MTLKAIVWTFVIIVIVGFHVHFYYEREAQKAVEYKRGYASGLARACDIVLKPYREVIINKKPFEIVRAY